ncbi:MAG: DUF3500 domain-containing protein [Saprospiraceae bacterium]|nr:DUF3500 domain-containing protein [Saprospiraceae bacterium]
MNPKNEAQLSFDDPDRLEWSNLPLEQITRKGLIISNLNDTQRLAVHALLRTVLSPQGYQKALFIIQYDEGIRQRLTVAQNALARRYGHDKYWITIFGTPHPDSVWAWQFEGHHLSLNFTHSKRGVTATPLFTGINPALTTSGMSSGQYIMADEIELGNQFFNSLPFDLKARATLAPHPVDADVMARTGKEAFLKEKNGIAVIDLSRSQQDLVRKIIAAWIENLTPQLANEKMKRAERQFSDLRFVWLGTDETKALHYYRLFSPNFVIELTHRDGGLQHYHSVWRDLEEDFKAK